MELAIYDVPASCHGYEAPQLRRLTWFDQEDTQARKEKGFSCDKPKNGDGYWHIRTRDPASLHLYKGEICEASQIQESKRKRVPFPPTPPPTLLPAMKVCLKCVALGWSAPQLSIPHKDICVDAQGEAKCGGKCAVPLRSKQRREACKVAANRQMALNSGYLCLIRGPGILRLRGK